MLLWRQQRRQTVERVAVDDIGGTIWKVTDAIIIIITSAISAFCLPNIHAEPLGLFYLRVYCLIILFVR